MKQNMTNERLRIGRRLAEIRIEKGLSVRTLSERCGITYQNINKIENGKYSVGIDVLATLCQALGCEVNITEVAQ